MTDQVVFFKDLDNGETSCLVEPMPAGIIYIEIINHAVEGEFQKKALEKMKGSATDAQTTEGILRDAAHEIAAQPLVSPTTCDLKIKCDNSPEGMALRRELLPISNEKDALLPPDSLSSRTIAWNNMDMAMKKAGLEENVRKAIIEKAGTMRAR